MDNKMHTLFSSFHPILSEESKQDTEQSKISYWLKKLHAQGEKERKSKNKKGEQVKKDTQNKLSQEKHVSKSDQESTQLGINAFTQNAAAKSEADRAKMNDLVRKSNRRIISISSLFPWSLFPNHIHVEESRVTFKFNQLFSTQSHSINIKDISNVFINSSIIFATLQVVSRTYTKNDIKIEKLSKNKAKKVQEVIEGLRTFAEHNMNTSDYEIDELISKIGEFNTSAKPSLN